MSIYEIDAKVKELKELRDMEAEVKSSIAAIEDSLKAEMLAKTRMCCPERTISLLGKPSSRTVLTAPPSS